jgi:hypothetical protein
MGSASHARSIDAGTCRAQQTARKSRRNDPRGSSTGIDPAMSDVPPPLPETEPEIPPPHRPVPDVPLTEPRPQEPPTHILPGESEPEPQPDPA